MDRQHCRRAAGFETDAGVVDHAVVYLSIPCRREISVEWGQAHMSSLP